LLEKAALHDPILQRVSLSALPCTADWIVEVGLRPGVTDNEGRTARDTAALVLDVLRRDIEVYTSTQYRLWGKLERADVERLAKDMLANELIERFAIRSGQEWRQSPGFAPQAAKVAGTANHEIISINIAAMDEAALLAFSQQNTLALSLEEMRAICAYFARPEVSLERSGYGLGANPTDAEIEVLAQTWSEHCKHKIFAARIEYEDQNTGKVQIINGLYKTYIQETTRHLRATMGKKDFCRSVFSDNAGVVAFNDNYDMCIKVETHNSPSALDPYGGALTGIVGVNRDPMGTGLGADLICNMDVFCFASPFYDQPLPPRLLHPRRVFEGVREGVEHGGNKSGLPTVNGSVVFEERFLGKPLVFCGTVGLIPRVLADGRKGYSKKAGKGDLVVMVGGRIGKDGIHGATFSSEELHQDSPATAVQIGDPITQRKMYDFIMRARDLGLYSSITDNGAGGLSSSVGEMAQDTGGCLIDLAQAPLKYDGLRPWEILLSEAQERMTLAVPPQHLEELLALAGHMDVEATPLGTFTDSGLFRVMYGSLPVACLRMDFLHSGVPQMRLKAVWPHRPPEPETEKPPEEPDHADLLKRMLGRLNICSKEYLIRQYDHEVQGGSVVKPLVGFNKDGPADAAVLRPVLDSDQGIVLGHGICPKFSDYDTYHMMALAIDEAMRNVVATGANPARLAGVDNFCWCDPVQSEKTPDGHYKLAQLVRACLALDEYCRAYGVPCVSGKDSMKNDYTGGGRKISIPPTALFTVLGVIDDVNLAVTSDFKKNGDYIYLLGATLSELAGSELASELGARCKIVPKVDAQTALKRYFALHEAIQAGLVSACHDLSDGGLGVALAEMCIGGRLGATLNLDKVPVSGAPTPTEILYSESASRLLVSVRPQHAVAFETLLRDCGPCARVGEVGGDNLRLVTQDKLLCELDLPSLAQAFKATLDW
jgi:phosphoribosylformylglycinamidine synthase